MSIHLRLLNYFTFLFLLTQSAFAADTAFEGYYKITIGGQHSGYVVQQYVVDAAKKEMTTTYYIYAKAGTNTTIESLVAKCDLSFEPKSYQYSAVVNGQAQSVDASFKNKKMTAKMTKAGKSQNVTLDVPANGFLSSFLNYVILKNGMMVGKTYDFFALPEEAPACYVGDTQCKATDVGFAKGTASIKAEQKLIGVDSYKIDFNFKSVPFTGFISAKGETLGSASPMQNLTTELVKTRAEAVANFPFKESHIKALFGGIPAGTKNSLVEKKGN